MDGIKYVGGSIGHHPYLSTKVLKEMDMTEPSSDQKINASNTSHQKYLARAFLRGLDQY